LTSGERGAEWFTRAARPARASVVGSVFRRPVFVFGRKYFRLFQAYMFSYARRKNESARGPFRACAADFPANVEACDMAPSLHRGGVVRPPVGRVGEKYRAGRAFRGEIR
jgi:hypothetical protein